MVQWLIIILVYDFAVLKLSLCEVTLSLRLLHYKNRNGLTYENRPCDTRLDHDINRDGRCDTGFLFCLVHLPFQNPNNCTLGDHFTGFVGGDEIHFINMDQQLPRRSTVSSYRKRQRSSLVSLWFQPTIYFRFKYPKAGIGLIVEVFDMDDASNNTIHDSIDFYGRTLTDLKLYRSKEVVQQQRIYLRSLFGTYTNLTADFALYCSPNYYGEGCETYCLPNEQRYQCDVNTGQKICNHGYFGDDCLSDVKACESHPCLNNGTCVVYLRSHLCQCQQGFAGRSCERVVSVTNRLCNQVTCVHGDCNPNGKCICHDGWTSKNCDQRIRQKTGCASHPCLHNSTCEDLIDSHSSSFYRCHCRRGFVGRNCEVAMVTACERTPCMHGQCLKIDLYTEVCVCDTEWTGIDCSQALSTHTTTLSTTTREMTTMTTRLMLKFTAIKSVKNLALTPITDDLRVYLDLLQDNDDTSKSYTAHESTSTSSTYHRNDYSPCLSQPCHHNSTCVVRSDESFQCICLPSFIGIYCEIETNPCESAPCQHHGICISQSNHDVHCICQPHYSGKYCEKTPSMQLLPNNYKCTRLCHNGGTCLIDESNKEVCICKSDFTGFHCEWPKNNCNDSSCNGDPCKSNPCLSNATCQSVAGSLPNYTCLCPEHYTGDRCESHTESDSTLISTRDNALNVDEADGKNGTDLWPLAIVFGYVFSLMLVFIIIWFLWYGLTVRPHSYFRSDIPYGERTIDRYQPYRLGVSNPLFFINQEYNSNQILKNFSD